MAPRFIAKQLAHPNGFMGAVIRSLMNRHNARMNSFALRQLQLEPTDHVLEIGFGGGLTLPSLLDATAFVTGLDRSNDAVTWAKRRFSKHIDSGRADFRQGDVEELPFQASTFHKVCTVNTVYFWTSLEAGFGEIYRVLKPRGRLLSASFRKNEWIEWACLRTSSRPVRRLKSSARSPRRDSRTC
jgi:ubiquinone/menaquinone biosynthesis C-methylase UbiE